MKHQALYTINFNGRQGMIMKAGKMVAVVVSIALTGTLFAGVQRLVMPKYMGDVLEGNFTEEYYNETTNHDVIFIGDCEVYENFSPIALWRDYGITSYVRGNAQQLIWQSYYLLEDTLKYETPKVVIYNVQSLMHAEPQKEEYNRMTLDGMKWSLTKLKAIQASMLEEENLLDYLFPLLRYHSRITELDSNDFDYYFSKKKVTHNGYYMRVDTTLDTMSPESYDEENKQSAESEEMENDVEASADDFMDFEDFEDVEEYDGEYYEEGEIYEDSESYEEDEIYEDSESGVEDGFYEDSESYEEDEFIDEDNEGIDNDVEASADDFMDFEDFEDVEEYDENVTDEELAETVVDNSDPDDEKYKFADYPLEYLDKIRKLCKDNDIQLIFVKAPSLEPVWYNAYEIQVEEYVEKYNIPYINYLEKIEELGIDYNTDSYDGGLHMNLNGAEKLSTDIGKVLTEQYNIKDHRGEKEYDKVYDEKLTFYNNMISEQKKEIEKYGKVINY